MIERYTRSAMKQVWSDQNKYDAWLHVKLAVCEAWAEEGTIPSDDMNALRNARYDLARVDHFFQITRHDMTAFDRSVAEIVGPQARWLHFGLTSSDVIDTALAMQLVQAGGILLTDVAELLEVLETKAQEHKDTLMMGRTHGVHAEPITFGLKLAVWWEEMQRNRHRLEDVLRDIAVGKVSGAVGTHASVPPSIEEKVCARLGLDVDRFSSQIIQRDRHAHLVTTLAVVAASLEKFATEIRNLQRTEVREVEEPFVQGQTRSSAMPHKRNPDLTERICGLARLIRGHAVTALENVALWNERDISHSAAERLILPDSCYALDYMLALFTEVMRGLRLYPERMRQNVELTRGLIFSQRVLLALVEKGLSREQAYNLVQSNAMRAWDREEDFRDLLRADPAVASHLPPSELESLFDYSYYTRYISEAFRRRLW